LSATERTQQVPQFTASDVIALVAVIVGPIVGLLTGLRLHEAQAKSEGERVRLARVHSNRKETYVDVLEYVYRIRDYVERTEPIVSFEGDPKPPTLPTDEDMRRLRARLGAFGSKTVRDELAEVARLANSFLRAVEERKELREEAREERKPGRGPELTAAREKAEGLRNAVREAVEHLVEQANGELAG
jgi:hypothetical protein